MKYSILVIITIVDFSGLYAQDPDPVIFEDTWYLTELVVDGNNVVIPSNSDFSVVTLDLTEMPPWVINTRACNNIGAFITEFTDTFFITNGFAIFSYDCFDPSTFVFENIYFSGFYEDSTPLSTYTYVLESVPNDALMLTIMNSEGDTAIYGNPALDISEFENDEFILYPNPASEKIFLKLATIATVQEINVINIHGRLMSKKYPINLELIEIETSNLYSGLYFVQVIDENGQVTVKRFVKK